ncbi:MAG: hypothetical protein IJ060_06840 [Oscillospiraceae bacterium]|nr:hypothetical protein [Oscillospiraceae bacterium]
MQRMKAKLSAAAASVLIAVTAAGAAPLSASAEETEPSVTMAMLAGGSQIGVEFIVSPSDGYDLIINGTACETDHGSYVLPVNPANMTDQITVSVEKNGSVAMAEKTVSVSSYLQGQLADATYGDVAKAMLIYGFAADQYFNGGADPEAYGLTAVPDYSKVKITAEPFSADDEWSESLSDYDLQYYGMNLTLLDQIRFSVFFEAAPQNDEYNLDEGISLLNEGTFGGDSVNAEANGDRYILVSKSISAAKLDEPIGLSVRNMSCVFKPSQYLAAAVQSSTASDDLKDLCKAIYAYGEAAAAVPNAGGYSGRLTWYEYKTGCAGIDDYVADYHAPVAAVTDELYNRYAGGWIEIDYHGNKINAIIADAMPYADNQDRVMGDVDLDKDSFEALTGSTGGDLPITWKIIENPYADKENMSLKLKSGTSQWWMQFQFLNSRYPIQYVTVEGISLEKKCNEKGLFYGFFGLTDEQEQAGQIHFGENGLGDGNGNYKVTLTDIYGNVVTDTYHIDLSNDRKLTEDTVIPLDVQFPK